MMRKKQKIIAVSGGFDPIHIGHVRLFEAARQLGDTLVVILNNDHWLRAKKGFSFMPQEERAEILRALPFVDEVIVTSHEPNDSDRSVSRELTALKPDVFANGGDRKDEKDIPEAAVCKQYGIRMVFNVGAGGKVQSSSWLTNAIQECDRSIRPWGQFRMLDAGRGYWVKTLSINPGHRLSLQAHHFREELWVCVRGSVVAELGYCKDGTATVTEKKVLAVGDSFFVPRGNVHRLSSIEGGTVVEVALGDPAESDITRYEDDYSRVV